MMNDELKMFLIQHSAFRVANSRVARLSADTDRPPIGARQSCVLQRARHSAESAPVRAVPFSHTPRLAEPGNTAVRVLPRWFAWRPDPGASAPALPLSVPV